MGEKKRQGWLTILMGAVLSLFGCIFLFALAEVHKPQVSATGVVVDKYLDEEGCFHAEDMPTIWLVIEYKVDGVTYRGQRSVGNTNMNKVGDKIKITYEKGHPENMVQDRKTGVISGGICLGFAAVSYTIGVVILIKCIKGKNKNEKD